MYGFSYLSLQSALSYYGIIPERVETTTSVTSKKDKSFTTPLGEFTYRYLSIPKYSIGVTQKLFDSYHPVLIATPEKALADMGALETPRVKNQAEMQEHLLENLRIDESTLQQLSLTELERIALEYRSSHVTLLFKVVKRLQR